MAPNIYIYIYIYMHMYLYTYVCIDFPPSLRGGAARVHPGPWAYPGCRMFPGSRVSPGSAVTLPNQAQEGQNRPPGPGETLTGRPRWGTTSATRRMPRWKRSILLARPPLPREDLIVLLPVVLEDICFIFIGPGPPECPWGESGRPFF